MAIVVTHSMSSSGRKGSRNDLCGSNRLTTDLRLLTTDWRRSYGYLYKYRLAVLNCKYL
jgi:hypothetical protein